MKFTIGCDPEAFLADVHGNLRAACGLIGGSKHSPLPLTTLGDGFAVQEDNVAIEFNIPPASSAREFVDSIQRTLKVLGDGVNDSLGLHINRMSAAVFDDGELVHPLSREFGCEPDFNAWTGRKNPHPKASNPNLRSCGGHVHVGFDTNTINRQRVIRMMDVCLGVPSVLMDEDEMRRELYGKMGAHRIKPFGVEYRTLSNFWIFHPRHIEWVYANTKRAVELADSPFAVDEYKDRILDAIDNNNKEVASHLCNELQLEVVHV